MTIPAIAPEKNASSPFSSWRVDHAGIRVPDFEAAVAWYTEKLDFRLTRPPVVRGGVTYAFMSPAADDHFSIELLAGPGAGRRPPYEDLHDSYKQPGWHHLGLRVDSVEDAVHELKRRGVTIVSEPHEVAEMGLRLAFLSDPWGNLLEVIQSINPSN